MKNINKKEKRRMEMKDDSVTVVRENFDRWVKSLLTKDPKMVASLYSEDVTFLPTVSPDFKHGSSEAKEYFVHFLAKNPEGEIKEDAVQQVGEASYLHSGLYNFTLDGEGERVTVEARFSFIWKKEGSEWKIIHHHSSMRPK